MAWYDYIPSVPFQLGKAAYNAYTGSQATDAANKARQDQMIQGLDNQAGMSQWFADQAQNNYGAAGAEAQQARDYLRRIASGQESLSREQLRQGMQQNRAAQQSFAASAAPQNQAMAAITGANNMAKAGYGMSGQAALAGIQERQGAQQALNQAILGARGQDLQAALGSRQNAINAYGGMGAPSANPDDKKLQQITGVTQGLLQGAAMFSDKRLKEDIEDGDSDANAALKGLRAYSYRYKNQKHGEGKQVGILAQELERAGLKHAVMDTPEGKAVHGAKLAGLEKRVAKIEGRK
jgi:hypothetical protein